MTVALSFNTELRTSIITADPVGDFIVTVRCILFGHFVFVWGKCTRFGSHKKEFNFM